MKDKIIDNHNLLCEIKLTKARHSGEEAEPMFVPQAKTDSDLLQLEKMAKENKVSH